MNKPVANSPVETARRPSEVASPTRETSPQRASKATNVEAGGQSSHAIRILCVDDHAVLVEGLKAHFSIKGQIEIVGHLSTATKLIEETRRLKPAAVLLDIEMPGPDAFEIASQLKRAVPAVRIMVLSAHIRDAFITASFASGVSGYFAKSEELSDIVSGVLEVMQSRPGTFVLGPKVRERCRPERQASGSAEASDVPTGGKASMRKGMPDTLLGSLTPREAEILRLIGKGLSRAQIAAQIYRSVKTVDGHQDRMMKKLGIKVRADLMRFSIREGLAQA
jgi:DNA-binding NarL/FixJ family response regulator